MLLTAKHRVMASLPRPAAAWLLVLAFTLPGCRVGPDFAKPPAQGIREDFQRAEGKTNPCADPYECWWRQYNDPVLNQLVQLGLDQNLSVREAAWRVLEARSRFRTARGEWFPNVSAVGDYAFRDNSENASQFNPGGAAVSAFDFYSLGFDSTWELDLFGRISRSVEAAGAEAEAETENLRDVKVTLVADVVYAYLEARSFHAQVLIAEKNAALQEETLRTITSRLEAGLIGSLDAAQAESNLLSTRSTIPQLRLGLEIALNRLAFLLGTTPSRFDTLGSTPPPPAEFDCLSAGVPAQLLSRRPDIRRAEREAAAASALIGVAVADRLPVVALRGSVSVESRDVSMLFETSGLSHSVGPTLRWNVLNFGRLKNVVEARRLAYYQSLVRYRLTALQAVREVEDGLSTYKHQQDRQDRLEEAVAATRRAQQLSQYRYEEGLVTFQRVLDTQRELAQVEGDLETSRWEVLRAVAQVHRALGAGWRCAESRACDCHELTGYAEERLVDQPVAAIDTDSGAEPGSAAGGTADRPTPAGSPAPTPTPERVETPRSPTSGANDARRQPTLRRLPAVTDASDQP